MNVTPYRKHRAPACVAGPITRRERRRAKLAMHRDWAMRFLAAALPHTFIVAHYWPVYVVPALVLACHVDSSAPLILAGAVWFSAFLAAAVGIVCAVMEASESEHDSEGP